MTTRVITPSGRGFLLLDAHPAGCERTVRDLAAAVPPLSAPRPGRRPVALVIGSSAGYGLATTVAGLVRYGITGLGICLEKAPGRRTGTAGWYRTAATADLASSLGSGFTFLNADAFSDEAKDQAAEVISARYGPVLAEAVIEPATEEETAATTAVMGGADWQRWINTLAGRELLAPGFRTVALTYIGSELTAPIYREGTIGAAKMDLEATAGAISKSLDGAGQAWACVNGAAVTQASTHIPGIALYVSLLRAVLGDALRTPAEQAVQLWDQLTGSAPLDTDEDGRIRLDRWELDPAVQADVARRWHAATPENIGTLADTGWFRSQFRGLYGFDVPGIDYELPVEADIPWPS